MKYQIFEYDIGINNFNYLNVDGLETKHASILAGEQLNLQQASTTNAVFIIFVLRGDCKIANVHSNQTYFVSCGHHNLIHSYEHLSISSAEIQTEIFIVKFPRDLFILLTNSGNESKVKYVDQINVGNDTLLNDKWGKINFPLKQNIQELIDCKNRGDLQKVYFISKCFELLVLCSISFSEAAGKKDVFLKNPDDKKKMEIVREILHQRITHPPNLNDIAKMTGLNVYKLKRGFKEVYNISVFKYLTEQRLNLAYQYLKERRKTAAEIAFQLGYATPQHFSYMFKKQFGLTPHQVKSE